MPKGSKLLLLGITGNLAFAAGCLLLALRRHSPRLETDILIYTDAELPSPDKDLLTGLGARLEVYRAPALNFTGHTLQRVTGMALSRLEGLRLLERYEKVLWLDVDIALQDDIAPLFEYGPLALAVQETFPGDRSARAGMNLESPFPGFDASVDSLNSGVAVMHHTLPDPPELYRRCMNWAAEMAPISRLLDQAVLNMLAQQLQQQDPKLFSPLPPERFNAHPAHPGATLATLAHCFGSRKPWNDGFLRAAFPEWARDYARWLAMGGSGWQGPVQNRDFIEQGALAAMLLMRSLTERQKTLEKELAEERAVSARLKNFLREQRAQKAETGRKA